MGLYKFVQFICSVYLFSENYNKILQGRQEMPMTITSIHIFNLIIWFSLSFQQNILEKRDFPYQDNELRHNPSLPNPKKPLILPDFKDSQKDLLKSA